MISLKREELIYYVSYALYVLAISFLTNVWPIASQTIRVVAVVLMVFNAIYSMRQFEKQIILRYMLVLLIVLFLGLKFKSIPFLSTFVFIYAFKSLNIEKVIKIDFVIRLFGMIATVSCCMLGIASDYVLEMYRSGGQLVARHSLGFSHPNTCFLMVFILVLDYLLLKMMKKEPIYIWHIVFLEGFVFVFEKATNCRAGFLFTSMAIIIFYLESKYKICERWKWFSNLICYSAPLGLCGSVLLVVIYKKLPLIGNRLNELFTKRISSMEYFYDQYGVSLLGNITKRVSTEQAMQTGERALVLDNFYANLLIQYGLIFTMLYLILHVKTSIYLKQQKQYALLLVFLIVSVYGVLEGVPINIDYNYFIVLFGVVLFSKNREYFTFNT